MSPRDYLVNPTPMKKSLLLIGAAYLAGIAIASRFGSEDRKTGACRCRYDAERAASDEDESDMPPCPCCDTVPCTCDARCSRCASGACGSAVDAFVQDVADIHERAWGHFSDTFLSAEMRSRIAEYQSTVVSRVRDFRAEAERRIEEIRGEGGDLTGKIDREVRELYTKYADQLRDVQSRSENVFTHAQRRGKHLWGEALTFLDSTYADIRREFVPTKKGNATDSDEDEHA